MNFLLPPFLGLVCLSPVLGTLGCFLLWRRMTFFGDALAHACVLGVGLSFLFKTHAILGLIAVTIGMAGILWSLEGKRSLPLEVLFGILSYAFLALGILLFSFYPGVHISVDDILFGDVLSLQYKDLPFLALFSGLGAIVCFLWYRSFLLRSVSLDLSHTYDKKAKKTQGIFLLLLSFTVAIALQFVGALLLPGLMMIPAATGRLLSRSPHHMIGWTIGFSVITSSLGILCSYGMDLPTSPTLIVCGVCVLLFAAVFKKR